MDEEEMDEESYDDEGKLTPFGLASWMDWEGGITGLYYHSGIEPFVEAGVEATVMADFESALKMVRAELERIGAVL